MSKNQPHNLTTLAQTLRKNQTNAERLLWYRLRDRRFDNYKFRRQFALPPYIADFCCEEARLVIELDGGQHAESTNQDAMRAEYFESHGYKVLRFWNNELFTNTEGMLEVILAESVTRTEPGPSWR